MEGTSDNIFILLLLSIAGVFMLIVSFLVIQARNQNKLLLQKKKLDEAEIAHQKELLHAVIHFQEQDRKRIGQNLHDDVGGELAVLRLLMSGKSDKTHIELIDRIIGSVRDISHNLSPQALNYIGICALIEERCAKMSCAGEIEAVFKCTETARSYCWSNEVAVAVYRILQELITNTLKHAAATQIIVSFDVADQIAIGYQDNGVGLTAGPHSGMGMANIISRLEMLNATWVVDAEKGKGYNLSLSIPL